MGSELGSEFVIEIGVALIGKGLSAWQPPQQAAGQRKAVAKATQALDTGAGEIETGLSLVEAGKADDKWEESQCVVTCPAHDWQFDVTNGECVTVDRCDDGCYVDTYPVKIENDEIILSLPS